MTHTRGSLVALALLASMVAGCGGGSGDSGGVGGNNGPSGGGGTVAGATTGSIEVRIGAPVQSRLAFDTATFSVLVENPSTHALLVPAVSGASTGGSLQVANVPLGPVLVVAQAFNSSGVLLTQGSQSLTIVPGQNSADIISDFVPIYVYTTNTVSQTINGFQLDPLTGALQALPNAVFPTAGIASTGAETLTVDNTGSFLYVCDETDGQLRVFSINPNTGGITAQPQLAVDLSFVSGDPAFLFPVITPDNRFLYIATTLVSGPAGFNDTKTQINGFSRNLSTGALTPIPGSPFDPGAALYSQEVFDPTMTLDRTGHFMYVINTGLLTSNGQEQVDTLELAIDQTTGALSPLPTFADPLLLQTFYANQGFSIQNTFSYQLVEPTTFTAGFQSVTVQSVAANGVLSPFLSSPSVTLQNPCTFADVNFDPTGALMILHNLNSLDLYTLNQTSGLPTFSSTIPPVTGGVDPGPLVFDPTNQFGLVPYRGTPPTNTDSGIGVYQLGSNTLTTVGNLVSDSGRCDAVVFAVPAPSP